MYIIWLLKGVFLYLSINNLKTNYDASKVN